LLEGCGTSMPLYKTTAQANLLSIPLEKFTGPLLTVRSAALENDILLVKKQDAYKALYLKCTHEGVGLTPTSKKIVCTAHGSLFDFDGNVLKEPALRPLKEFKTEINNNNIIIHLT
jgi:cytochrome b6-f complex iron-sulfur subunit